jgi:hypothetical protein
LRFANIKENLKKSKDELKRYADRKRGNSTNLREGERGTNKYKGIKAYRNNQQNGIMIPGPFQNRKTNRRK